MDDVRTIDELGQVRAIADPLRVRIVQCLRERAATIAEVARRLDDRPQRLYYHVTALEKAGLIQVVETRRKGNLVERVYRATARLFLIDPRVFRQGPEGKAVQLKRLHSAFGAALRDAEAALSDGRLTDERLEHGFNTYFRVRLGEDQLERFYRGLRALLRELKDEDDPGAPVELGIAIGFNAFDASA